MQGSKAFTNEEILGTIGSFVNLLPLIRVAIVLTVGGFGRCSNTLREVVTTIGVEAPTMRMNISRLEYAA